MKKLLGIVVLYLLFSGNVYSEEKKYFYISCAAKGYQEWGLSGNRYVKEIIDEYKITIGKGDVTQGNRWPKAIELINTNANQANVFYLHRDPIDTSVSYTNKIIGIGSRYETKGMTSTLKSTISLISGVYNLSYRDNVKKVENDTQQYSAIGECSGLVPVLSYLENKKNDGGSNSGSSGTAFFVSNKGHLLTNNHVVDGCKVSKISYKGKDYDTKLIATDKTLDLALLKAELRPKSFFNFSKDNVKKLNKVYVAGYPLGKGLSDDLKISSGIVSSLKGFQDNSNEIQIDAPINPGNSGGPIINENGDLIAIAVSGLAKDQTEGINFGIKSSAAELFLRSNKVTPKKAMYSRIKDNDKLLEILEQGTVYTYCD